MAKKYVGFAAPGPYTCTHESHPDKPHTTNDINEHFAHIEEEGHYLVNSAGECALCHNSVVKAKWPMGLEMICDSCKEKARKLLDL